MSSEERCASLASVGVMISDFLLQAPNIHPICKESERIYCFQIADADTLSPEYQALTTPATAVFKMKSTVECAPEADVLYEPLSVLRSD